MKEMRALASRIAAVRPPVMSSLSDEDLLAGQAALGDARRRLDALGAEFAAEIARRSARELGHDGLAQRLGARTASALVQRLTGTTARDAGELVGALSTPGALADAVRGGTTSVGQAAAIRGALDGLADEVAERAAASLLTTTAGRTVEETRACSRELRDDLDSLGIAAREEELRERRYLHLYPQSDGMTRLVGLLDPESAARIRAVVDAATSPRRGGPRFVDPEARARAERIVADERTTEQLALDGLVDVLRAGLSADPAVVPGPGGAPVQVLVAAGAARIEGQPCSVSSAVGDRIACTEGFETVAIASTGQVIDLGRTRRLFTRPQRRALAARDGGCRFPGCARPPSWTEAHHIRPWAAGGRTDLAEGILLCRHHHLLLHNNGWVIQRDDGGYWLIPPRSVDPARERIAMPTKSPLIWRLTG
ncbi:MAG: DUF222 domain-containing protein [Micrococcales bacterium]|nr:DUF222 domain-containing protein [Micrococcales bacterium]